MANGSRFSTHGDFAPLEALKQASFWLSVSGFFFLVSLVVEIDLGKPSGSSDAQASRILGVWPFHCIVGHISFGCSF